MKTIKVKAEEMMSIMSRDLNLPYSPTMISAFEGILIEYKEDIIKLINEIVCCEGCKKLFKQGIEGK